MIAYILVLLVPCMLAQMKSRRISFASWAGVFVLYVWFVGLRDGVGPDWGQYWNIHESLRYVSFAEVMFQSEPLSHILFWLSQHGGMQVYLTYFVAALILMYGVFAFARCTVNPWLAIVAASPYFIFITGMSGVRQIMAAGVMLFLLSRWQRYHMLKRAVYVLVAALFHTSALANSLFLITQLAIALRYKLIAAGMILGVTFLVGSEASVFAGNIQEYQERYIVNSAGMESAGVLFHIAMILMPAVLAVYYRSRLLVHIHNPKLLQFGVYAAFFLLVVNFISSTAASRLTLYLYFVPMMVYPAFSKMFGPQKRQGVVVLISLFHMLIILVWFQLSYHSPAYAPYDNLLLPWYNR